MTFAAQLEPAEVDRRRRMRASTRARRQVREVIDRQVAEVDRLPERAMRSLLPVLTHAQAELARDLRRWTETRPDGDVRFTAHSYRNALAQIEVIRRRIDERMDEAMGRSCDRAQRLALDHLVDEVARYSELFEGATRRLSLNVTAQLATGRSYIIPRVRTSAARYAGQVGDDLQRNLAVGILRGESVSAMVDRLQRLGGPAGLVALRGVRGEPGAVLERIPEGLFARYRWWAERVVRTETQSAYNGQLLDGLHEARRQIPGLKKRWSADGKACDRICGPVDGQVQPLEAPFVTPRGLIEHAPAHPNCRCRSGAWKDDWNDVLRESDGATSAGPGRLRAAQVPGAPPSEPPMTDAEMIAVMGGVLDQHGLTAWVVRSGTSLTIADDLGTDARGNTTLGAYDPTTRTIVVSRAIRALGERPVAGALSVSVAAALTPEDALRRVFAHELGEAIFDQLPVVQQGEFRRAWRDAVRERRAITRYATYNLNEYVAESVGLYITDSDVLESGDQEAFRLVRTVFEQLRSRDGRTGPQ
jgi:hypothetical protein